MNENICLANFSSKMKVNGKVDLQYVMEDGSVIHNEAKNTAFPSTWAASGLIKSLLRDSTILLELTDSDDAPNMNFPFLKGEPVGYAYLGSTSSGNYRGTEVTNKRVFTLENGKLVISFTYEWTASQIPGVIRSIGYTLQNRDYFSDHQETYSWLTLPIINSACAGSFYAIVQGNRYEKVYDYLRSITWALSEPISSSQDTAGFYLTIPICKYSNDGSFTYISKTIKVYLTDYKAYSYSTYGYNMLYSVDDGSVSILCDYYVKKDGSSDYEIHRCLIKIDFENAAGFVEWDVNFKSSSTITQDAYAYLNPFRRKGISNYAVLIEKNGQIYMKLAGSASTIISYRNENPEFTSTFCFTDKENLKLETDVSMFSFCKKYPKIIVGDYLYDFNYGFSYYTDGKGVIGWVLNASGDIAYINTSESVLRDSTYASSAFSAAIDPETKQAIYCRILYSGSNNYLIYPGDGAIDHISNGNEKIYFVTRHSGFDNNTPLSWKWAADAQVFQALTHFHVPAEAQVRPENSGVRIVYELTISNPT